MLPHGALPKKPGPLHCSHSFLGRMIGAQSLKLAEPGCVGLEAASVNFTNRPIAADLVTVLLPDVSAPTRSLMALGGALPHMR